MLSETEIYYILILLYNNSLQKNDIVLPLINQGINQCLKPIHTFPDGLKFY